MERAERLTAYLAGELSADERGALEAELARDAQLRADLEAIRRADGALAAQPPTALPDGARDRLLAALEPTLTSELGPRQDATVVRDELAVRRRATARRSWVMALGGVAAALTAVAIIGPTLGGVGGADQEVASDMGSEAMLESEGGGEEAGSAPAAPVGPTLVGSGRVIDEDGAAELLAAGEVEAVVAQDLSPDDAETLGGAWAVAFGSGTESDSEFGAMELEDASGGQDEAGDVAESAADPAADDGAAAEGEAGGDGAAEVPYTEDSRTSAAVPTAVADLQILGDVDRAAREDVARCLAQVLEGATSAVPVLAELVTFEGEPAVAFALVTPDADGAITRREVWVLAREDCQTRYWQQG